VGFLLTAIFGFEITFGINKCMKHIHHIIPKHIGGTNEASNLIELSVKDHALAHKKLYEEHDRWQDYCAWKALSGRIGKEEILRIKQSMGMKGKKHSEETKQKLREHRLGTTQSEETKKKMSISASGKVRTPEHAKNNRDSRLANGKVWHDSNTKSKISETMKKQVKEKCPHCDKAMGVSNLAYHIIRKHGETYD